MDDYGLTPCSEKYILGLLLLETLQILTKISDATAEGISNSYA